MAPVCVRPIFLREAGMMDSPISEGLTFDAVLLLPGKSSVLPTEVDTTTNFARQLPVNIPLASAAMDTVTESRLAIAIARQGGIGMVHRNMSDRKSTRLNSSHLVISYAVFCLKKKKK